MDPARKRKIRLVIALSAAVLLAAGLVYTSFSASSEVKEPSEAADCSGHSCDLTGEVVPGTIRHQGDQLDFRLADRDGSASVPVTYSGVVPDPFRDGREVIVTGEYTDGTFVGERDTLITKCPSKFQEQAREDPEHVVIDESS
jgi:cytochrome c-type biogenesis protein CcmE